MKNLELKRQLLIAEGMRAEGLSNKMLDALWTAYCKREAFPPRTVRVVVREHEQGGLRSLLRPRVVSSPRASGTSGPPG